MADSILNVAFVHSVRRNEVIEHRHAIQRPKCFGDPLQLVRAAGLRRELARFRQRLDTDRLAAGKGLHIPGAERVTGEVLAPFVGGIVVEKNELADGLAALSARDVRGTEDAPGVAGRNVANVTALTDERNSRCEVDHVFGDGTEKVGRRGPC